MDCDCEDDLNMNLIPRTSSQLNKQPSTCVLVENFTISRRHNPAIGNYSKVPKRWTEDFETLFFCEMLQICSYVLSKTKFLV